MAISVSSSYNLRSNGDNSVLVEVESQCDTQKVSNQSAPTITLRSCDRRDERAYFESSKYAISVCVYIHLSLPFFDMTPSGWITLSWKYIKTSNVILSKSTHLTPRQMFNGSYGNQSTNVPTPGGEPPPSDSRGVYATNELPAELGFQVQPYLVAQRRVFTSIPAYRNIVWVSTTRPGPSIPRFSTGSRR
jgi:hypothetical protein